MFLGLALCNYFVIWEEYLVGVSLGRMDGHMIGTVEVFLVGLSLERSLESPLEFPNPGAELHETLLG